MVERTEALAGLRSTGWRRIQGGGFSPAERWIVRFEDGSSVFLKAGVNEWTARWLRMEHRMYAGLSADYQPELRGWDDDEGIAPILVLEDLSGAHWPPPWSAAQVDGVLTVLDRVRASAPPEGLEGLEVYRDEFRGWHGLVEDPDPFLGLSLCSGRWFGDSIGALVDAEARADLSGGELLHLDVRSDNVCFSGLRTLLVDWNWACVGNAVFDVAFWLPSLHAEGGPAPGAILTGQPEVAAVVSGFFASYASQPWTESQLDEPEARRLRAMQLSQLRTALPWAAHELGLPPPASPAQAPSRGR